MGRIIAFRIRITITRYCEGPCTPLGDLLLGFGDSVGPVQGPFPAVLVGDSEQLDVVCLHRERGGYCCYIVISPIEGAVTFYYLCLLTKEVV